MELIITQRLSDTEKQGLNPILTLALTAEERSRSRYTWETDTQDRVILRLPRGTILKHGDFLTSEKGEIVQILAKPEAVLTVKTSDPLELLRVTYHLGNRHVALEIHSTYVRLSPDPVLKTLLNQFKVEIIEEKAPFEPEIGAYHSH